METVGLSQVVTTTHFLFNCSVMSDLCDPTDCSMPGFLSFTMSQSLLKLMCIKLMMPSSHLIFCHPFLFLPSIFPSIRVFSNESALCIRWQEHWSFSFSISPSSEYSELISFRIDWFYLLAVQGTLKSPPAPQFESINSLALNLLYGPNFTSVHNYWKNRSFNYMDLNTFRAMKIFSPLSKSSN